MMTLTYQPKVDASEKYKPFPSHLVGLQCGQQLCYCLFPFLSSTLQGKFDSSYYISNV